MDAVPTPQPTITWAEMAAIDLKRHRTEWGLGSAGGTPMGSNQLNEDRKAKGEKSRLIITAFLNKNPGVKRAAIARGLGINQNTLQSQLQRLHSTGIINRSASNEYTNAVTV
jgi:DNA invertase Pin-like site-specific DNA recombinase